MEISFWDLTRPIYYNCQPTDFSEYGKQPVLTKLSHQTEVVGYQVDAL